MKKKVIIIGAILLALSLSSLFFNSKKEVLLGDTIPTLQAWMIGAGNIITPRVSTNSVQIPSLASSGLCVATNASGTLISSACGTASATTTWGTIIGTLSNQTDLQNALNDKLSTTTAYSTYVPYSGSNSDLDLNAKNLKNFFISKIADATAKFTFDVSGLSSSTTRTLAVQDKSGTVALTSDLSAYLSTTTASSTYLKLDQTTPQTTVGTFSFPKVGANVIKPITDGTTAIQFTKADGTTTVMNLDTTNSLLNLTSFQNTASNWAINNSNMSFASGIPILWSSTGLYYNTKDVGLQRNAAGVLEINNSNAGTFADLKLRNLYTSGNVGIGTTTPSEKLGVIGNVGISPSGVIGSGLGYSGSSAGTANFANLQLYNGATGYTTLNNQGYGIKFQTAGSDRLTILNGGNVGIGTTNPAVKFDVAGSIATRTIGTEDEFHLTRLVNSGVSNVQLAAFKLGTYSNSGTNPATRLDIDLKSAGDNNLTADKNVMTLLDNGNVGIGTSTPSEILHVIGNGLFSGTLNASNLSGTNTGNESTTTIGVLIASSTATTTPADADLFAIYGSITSNLQNITWANLKSAILSYISSVTATFTNKRITPRVGSVTSSSTPIINTDNYDAYSITAQAGDITSFTTNLSGTPTNFQKLMIRIKDNGSARAITWGASFASGSATLPTTTTTGKTLLVGFIYDSVDSLWYCEAVGSRP